MTSNIDKTDTELRSDVLAELEYEPCVRVTDIVVQVKDGAVTLSGFTTGYGEKIDAVCAVKRVAGVTSVTDDIEVRLPVSLRRADGDIAAAAANQIDWSSKVPKGTVRAAVHAGRITLEGEVEWGFQKQDAEDAVQHLPGIEGVTNLISIKPKVLPAGIETAITLAVERNAQLDATKIVVETSGNQVLLRGEVRNYAERREAERAAWAAPGVLSVENELSVTWTWFAE